MGARSDIITHIIKVRAYLKRAVDELSERAFKHDASKLEMPEIEGWESLGSSLAGIKFGSPEYIDGLRRIKPTIEHHYKCNRHHPQHFANGYKGMNLIDMMELVADWMAAAQRNKDGDVRKSIEMNQHRDGVQQYSDDVKAMMLNTVEFLEHE